MLPAELMGLNYKKFRQLNNLVKNKNFYEGISFKCRVYNLFFKRKKI